MFYRVWKVAYRPDDVAVAGAHRLLFSVSSPREACTAIQRLQAREREDPIARAAEYGLEVFSVTGWTEWHDPKGRDVMARLSAQTTKPTSRC